MLTINWCERIKVRRRERKANKSKTMNNEQFIKLIEL